jgi:mannose-6-phosphate isomerase-like protein (cupin superfamily)
MNKHFASWASAVVVWVFATVPTPAAIAAPAATMAPVVTVLPVATMAPVATVAAAAAIAGAIATPTPTPTAVADPPDLQRSMAEIFHVSNARGPIRPVGLSAPQGEVTSEILAGPANGLDSAYVIYTRMAARARPRGLYTLPVEHTYLVLSGKLNVQIGTDQFVIAPETLTLVPAGVPHQAWNENAAPEVDFEVITPAPSRDLVSMMRRAEPRKVDNAAQYIRAVAPPEKLAGGTGHDSLNERVLANRATGSEYVLERLNDVLPGGGRTELHIHPFDQIYFITRGTMTVQYGLATYAAGENTLVLLPAGVVHSNQNKGTSVQSAITLLLPEPPKGTPLGAGVQIESTPGQSRQ